METEVGRRVHVIVGRLAGTGPTPRQVLDEVHDLWRERPYGGTTLASARLRCSTAVSVYFQRCHPDKRWKLTGVEVALDGAVADLVWTNTRTGKVIIDELKTGIADPNSNGALTEQLKRLSVGGRHRFDGSFSGVRLVPIMAPGRIQVYDVRNSNLAVVRTPAGMAVR